MSESPFRPLGSLWHAQIQPQICIAIQLLAGYNLPSREGAVIVCPGCGARNEADARACDWCGRPFVAEQRQITAPWLIPATVGAIALLAIVTIVAALLGARAATPRDADVASSVAAAPPAQTEAVAPVESESPAAGAEP